MNTITIEGQLRTEFGKSATRQVRSQGHVPAVIYGGAKEVSFSAPASAFRGLVYTPNFQLADVNIDGAHYKCILKDLQFDKVTDELIHVDLLELVEDKKVIATIPLRFTGTAIGVREGGRFVPKIKSVKVKTYPKHLKEVIEVPIDTLEINSNIRVEEIVAPDMEILNSRRIPVASVVLTRQLKQEEAAAAKEAKK